MERSKLFPTSIILLAICLVISAIIVSRSIRAASFNLQNGLARIQIQASPTSSYQYKDTMSIYQAASYLEIDKDELEKLITDKKIDIPYTEINSHYVFCKSAIDKWVEKNQTKESN